MTHRQVDLPAMADVISKAYDQTNAAGVPLAERDKLRVAADVLAEQFYKISGRLFDDDTTDFKASTNALSDALDTMNGPLAAAKKATQTLKDLKGLIGIFDKLLTLLG